MAIIIKISLDKVFVCVCLFLGLCAVSVVSFGYLRSSVLSLLWLSLPLLRSYRSNRAELIIADCQTVAALSLCVCEPLR